MSIDLDQRAGMRDETATNRPPTLPLLLITLGFLLVAAGTLAACSIGGLLLGIGLSLTGHHD